MAVVTRAPAGNRRWGQIARAVLIAAVVLYLVLPLFSTVLFSLATAWSKTVLPEGYTLNAYRESFADPQIIRGIQRSLTATVATLLVGLALVVPALLYVHLRAPTSNAGWSSWPSSPGRCRAWCWPWP